MSWTARDLMKTDVRTVEPSLPLVELERRFLDDRVSGFPVVESGRLVGIVSRSDIVRQLSVEQTVGELMSDYYRSFDSGVGTAPATSLDEIARHVGRRMESLCVKDVMIGELLSVSPDDSVFEVARLLVEHRIHRLPVAEGGRLVGIITSLDFVGLFADDQVRSV
ncbi:MAG: CBS domain-containing protein [Myxococcota bacterium]|nr:CBS domain-containing protein [Myxococcota bacterium]